MRLRRPQTPPIPSSAARSASISSPCQAWELIAGWLFTLAVLVSILAVLFLVAAGGGRLRSGQFRDSASSIWRGVSIAASFLLLALAIREYVGRFDRLFASHTIFSGVTYTDAHITLTGMLFISVALVVGAVIAFAGGLFKPRARWLLAAVVPAAVCWIVTGVAGWYTSTFIVNPNRLNCERPYIVNNIALTRQAFGLDQFVQREFPADTTVAAADPEHNQATLENIRLWDVNALQATLRQLQEIRTYYDFPGIDIDRYQIDGALRQVMLAVRELNVDKLPETSRNWVSDKLIYTHGYGITMNPVNGFSAEGLPTLYLSNMPVQSTVPGLKVTRPEIYFGELTNTDVYVKTGQQEFNYSQGQNDSYSTYEGTGGIVMGGFLRRVLLGLRSRRPDQGSLQQRHRGPEPPADAAQRARARSGAGAVSHLRSRSLHCGRRRWAPVVDHRRLHFIFHLSLLRGGRSRRAAGQLHSQQREGGG